MKHILFMFAVILAGLVFVQPIFAQEPPADDDDSIQINIDVDDSEAVAEDLVDLTVGTTEVTTSALEDFLESLINTPQSDLMRLILVVGGVILLVAGWRVYDYIVVIAGFIIGAAIALSLVNSDSTLVTVGAILTAGLIGAALSAFVYPLGVFLIGAYVGIVLTGVLAGELSATPISPLILLLGGLIGGLILLQVSFHFLVVVSSVVGAQMLTLGLALEPAWTLILAIVGIIVQLYLVRHYNYGYRRRPSNPLRRVFT
jgi:hypothetical protein